MRSKRNPPNRSSAHLDTARCPGACPSPGTATSASTESLEQFGDSDNPILLCPGTGTLLSSQGSSGRYQDPPTRVRRLSWDRDRSSVTRVTRFLRLVIMRENQC